MKFTKRRWVNEDTVVDEDDDDDNVVDDVADVAAVAVVDDDDEIVFEVTLLVDNTPVDDVCEVSIARNVVCMFDDVGNGVGAAVRIVNIPRGIVVVVVDEVDAGVVGVAGSEVVNGFFGLLCFQVWETI